ncbi:hypothetical protein Mgra_00002988 [Meloidogyne graminicola]|uniref:Probable pectate lyase F n=1 Tax=Meloidogyne graminicola TaxID=189291 RepID=A0A8S9ZV29_9BILA|nr:hypothetical protein Mgra_00002988 [Meloidogyne graminicola]
MKLFYLFSFLIIFCFIFQTMQFSLEINKDGKRFCNFPKASSVNNTNKAFFISGHYDFGMQRIIYTSANKGTCNPNIPKQWDSVITIQDGGSISNVILGVSPDGTSADINCLGSCKLTNVYWEKVCWRAASFRAPSDYNYNRMHKQSLDSTQFQYIVEGGGAVDAFQKVFDQSGPGKTIVNNFCAANAAIILRSCGDCGLQYPRDLTITNSKFMGPGLTLIGANTNPKYTDRVTLKNIQVYGQNNKNTKIAYACQEIPGKGYAPGEKVICLDLSQFEELQTKHRKGKECWFKGDVANWHYFGYRNYSIDNRPCLKWIDNIFLPK